jgi:hypothetical protein
LPAAPSAQLHQQQQQQQQRLPMLGHPQHQLCIASPLRTQSIGSVITPDVLLPCLPTAGLSCGNNAAVSRSSSSSRSGLASAGAAFLSPRQQQQQLGVASAGTSPMQQLQQHSRLSSSTGAAAAAPASGRLSPYASSLVAPVRCDISYTVTPRSAAAAAVTGGSGSSSAGGSRAGLCSPRQRLSTPRSARR